jgi:hypothetical protein
MAADRNSFVTAAPYAYLDHCPQWRFLADPPCLEDRRDGGVTALMNPAGRDARYAAGRSVITGRRGLPPVAGNHRRR